MVLKFTSRLDTNVVIKILNELGDNPNNKVIITCRSDYLSGKNLVNQSPPKEYSEKYQKFTLRWPAPIGDTKIEQEKKKVE